MRPLGAFSSVVSYWASYSLTGNAAEDCALFLLPRTRQGQKEGKMMKDSNNSGARGDVHAFAFGVGKNLNRMGAAWFVSYADHEHVDAKHLNWNRVTTKKQLLVYGKTFSCHRYWLDKVMSMNDRLLATNKIDLTATQVKTMAEQVMAKNW